MKRKCVLLIAMIVCGEVAQAGDVKVKVAMTASPGGEEKTTFAPDTAKVFAMFQTKGAKNGDKIRGLWIAEDVEDAAPANSKIDEKTLTMQGDTNDGVFSLSKPTKGWPEGKYRIEVYFNGELATTAKFTIKGRTAEESAESEESADSDQSAKSPDTADREYSFKVHNTTKDRITKLLASEDGEEYGSYDVGRAGIGLGRTMTLKWDKSTNNSKCQWFIKAVFDDGSETEAKKFDFCEEDLQLDF